MKRIFLLSILICSSFFALAQIEKAATVEINTVRSDTIRGKFLLEKEGIKFLQNLQINNQHLKKVLRLNKEKIQLKEHTDLAIPYKLIAIEGDLKYELNFSLYDENNEKIPLYIEKKRGDYGIVSLNKEKGNYEYIQNDITESNFHFGKIYKLEISCQLKGFGLNCDEPFPKFDWSFKKRKLYYAFAAAGIITATIGTINQNSYQMDYNDFLDLWGTGSTLAEAQPAYDKATDKRNRNKNLILIGTGVAIGSALALLNRWKKKHRPKVKLYEKYCREKVATANKKPEIIPASEGMGLAIQF